VTTPAAQTPGNGAAAPAQAVAPVTTPDPKAPDKTPAPGNAAPNAAPAGGAGGAEARINELTAKMHAMERAYEDQRAHWQTQEQRYRAALGGGPVETEPQDPVEARFARLERMLHQTVTSLGYQQQQQALEWNAARQGLPEPVVAKAKQLQVEQMQRYGQNLDWDTAVTHAFGIVSRDDYAKRAAAGPNANLPPPMWNAGAAPAPNLAPRPQGLQKPQGFENWSLPKQAAWYRNNMPDVPLKAHGNRRD
jgi:hypothetical protein